MSTHVDQAVEPFAELPEVLVVAMDGLIIIIIV
jgi:hypothetical protein